MASGCSSPFSCNIVYQVAAKAVLISLFALTFAHAQSCGVGTAREARNVSLRRAGTAVLSAIEQKDTEGLLRYVDSSGMAFGPDKTPLSHEDLRHQFAHREGAYCLFFSTECIPNMDRFKGLEPYPALSKWKISYFDWLSANKTYTIFADLSDDAGVGGCAGAFYAETQQEMKNAPNDIELDFTFYKGRWWLAYTVEGVP